ncbi:hypothetical protein Y1Q_0003427 [Alligator mississippiensis]|uniref:Uncharacterized protein n=1 Tax=Alligator mississippiensis TaxID=8496 RepID=A0A151N4Z4_ALLMI|nr:hypothetical protein Y1Q_0003427 [Alligator mississippiensis]
MNSVFTLGKPCREARIQSQESGQHPNQLLELVAIPESRCQNCGQKLVVAMEPEWQSLISTGICDIGKTIATEAELNLNLSLVNIIFLCFQEKRSILHIIPQRFFFAHGVCMSSLKLSLTR